MTKKEKYIITVFCLILLALAGFMTLRYYHRVSAYYAASVYQETAQSQIPITGYEFSTIAGDLTTIEHPDGITSRKTFTHKIVAPDGQDFAAITITVTGNIAKGSGEFTHISTSLNEEIQDGLTVSEHISGQTATIVLYMNQISVCHFQYRLSTDGSIVFL